MYKTKNIFQGNTRTYFVVAPSSYVGGLLVFLVKDSWEAQQFKMQKSCVFSQHPTELGKSIAQINLTSVDTGTEGVFVYSLKVIIGANTVTLRAGNFVVFKDIQNG